MRKIKDPSKKANKKKLPLHPAELVWYIVCGLVGLWGLTYIVLGLIAENLPITSEDNDFVAANAKFADTFGLDWLGWGLIIFAIAAIAAAAVNICMGVIPKFCPMEATARSVWDIFPSWLKNISPDSPGKSILVLL